MPKRHHTSGTTGRSPPPGVGYPQGQDGLDVLRPACIGVFPLVS